MTHTKRPRPVMPPRLAIACFLLAAAAPAAAAPYLFTEVAQTEAYPDAMDAGRAAVAGPALNEAGAVAFRRVWGGVDGVYTRAPGGPVVPVATTADAAFRAFGRAPDLNEAGAVVFHAFTPDGGEGLYVAAPGAQRVTVADTADGTIRHFAPQRVGQGAPSLPAINNAGVVACVVDRQSDTLNTATLLRYEGGVTSVAAEGRILGSADVNNRGEVVFVTALNEVRVADGAGVRLLAGPIPLGQWGLVWAATSNDRGLIVTGEDFIGGIFLVEEGAVTKLRTRPGLNFLGGFSLNERGEVAFINWGASAVHAGDPAAPERVIGEGDALFGSNITDLNYSREGFNDAGQVAFFASLADGRNVIALATPVPEPAAACSLLVAGLALLARRSR